MVGMSFPISGGYQKPDPYLFIDGNCLRAELANFARRYFDAEAAKNWSISGIAGSYSKVFFYDALPAQLPEELDDQFEIKLQQAREEFARFALVPNSHVRTGHTKARAGRRKGLEQKGVDVLLAVDVLSMAHRGSFREMTLLTGDADFRPLIDELIMMGLNVTLWHPSTASVDLREAADRLNTLSPYILYGLLDEDYRARNPFPAVANYSPGDPYHRQILHVDLQWTEEDGSFYQFGTCPGGPVLECAYPNGGFLVFTGAAASVIATLAHEVYGIAVPLS